MDFLLSLTQIEKKEQPIFEAGTRRNSYFKLPHVQSTIYVIIDRTLIDTRIIFLYSSAHAYASFTYVHSSLRAEMLQRSRYVSYNNKQLLAFSARNTYKGKIQSATSALKYHVVLCQVP